jgi:hypothetical protein
MFFPPRSRLEFQRPMKERRRRSHLETLSGGCAVPSDSPMRDILAPLPGEPVRPLLPALFEKMRRGGWAKRFQTRLATGNQQGDYSSDGGERVNTPPPKGGGIRVTD